MADHPESHIPGTLSFEKVNERYIKAKQRAQRYHDYLERVYDVLSPNTNPFDNDEGLDGVKNMSESGGDDEGQNKAHELYDATANSAWHDFASKMASNLTPSGQQWIKFVDVEFADSDEEVDDDNEIIIALQAETKKFFLEIENSNFSLVMDECYHEFAVSTATLFAGVKVNKKVISDKNDKLLFRCVPRASVCFEESIEGDIKTVFRNINEKMRDVRVMWPEASFNNSDHEENDLIKLVDGVIYDEGSETYSYVLLDIEDKRIAFQTHGATTPAFIAYRWRKMPGEIDGRGPAQDAYPTMKTLNSYAKSFTVAMQFAAAPPIMVDSAGSLNPYTARIRPATMIVVKTPTGTLNDPPMRKLDLAPVIPFQNDWHSFNTEQINTMFFAQPLGTLDDKVRSATEISIRQRNFVEKQQPVFSRFKSEMLDKTIERTVFILNKMGRMKLKPTGDGRYVLTIGESQRKIQVSYEAPVFQSEAQTELANFEQAFGILQQIYGEQAIAFVDAGELLTMLKKTLNVPAELLIPEEKAKQIQERVEQALQGNIEQQQGQLPAPAQTDIPEVQQPVFG